MKRDLTNLFTMVFILLISGVIALCVALPFALYYSKEVLPDLLWSFVMGIVIGGASTYGFSLFMRHARRNPVGSFILVSVTIGIGTTIASVVLSVEKVWHLVAMIALAETIGLMATWGIYRYTQRLNNQLLKTQERFTKPK